MFLFYRFPSMECICPPGYNHTGSKKASSKNGDDDGGHVQEGREIKDAMEKRYDWRFHVVISYLRRLEGPSRRLCTEEIWPEGS